VVFDDADYAYARGVTERFPEVPMYLQVGNDNPPGAGPDGVREPDVPVLLGRYAWLSGKVLADGWNTATVLPQLHVLVHGNKRGV
jgi:7-carboxy-7-deazaguanine synthase